MIFMRSGYQLSHYRSQHEPYDEDYSLGTAGLLSEALKQVSQEFERRSVLFVEDTSVRIEALSDETDYPGTRVKEWFSETSFDDLDRQIALRGSNRRCTVKSDIALRLPSLSRPIFFHGETSGRVADSAPTFGASPQYPWLTPDTFNGWFIPDGSNRRLGEMEFEDSIAFDFRAKSLKLLIERLEELNAVANLGRWNHIATGGRQRRSRQPAFAAADRTPRRTGRNRPQMRRQIDTQRLPDWQPPRRVRAGGEHASAADRGRGRRANRQFGRCAVVPRAARLGRGGEARCGRVARENADLSVITGMRTVEEVLWLRSALPAARVVLIEADARTRFERHLRRARADEARTFRDFAMLDEEQTGFGALRVAHEIADVMIRNDADLNSYWRRIDELVATPGPFPSTRTGASELHRSLRALRRIGRAATCDEIAAVTAEQGPAVRKLQQQPRPKISARVRDPRREARRTVALPPVGESACAAAAARPGRIVC